MAMSWGWTPLCRVGSERYRISATADRPPPPSVVISSTQCGYGLSQLPPETSVVLSAPRQGTVSSQLPMLSPVRSQISPDYSSQPAAENQSTTSSAEERVVRRSPRLARSNRVSYREDGETQANRTRSPWNNPSQQDRTMWNSDRGQSNCNQQSNKSYSVYNYDGQTHPLINTSVSIVYNHNKNLINNVAQSRVPLTPFTAAKTSVPTNSIRSANKKVTIKSLDFYDVVTSLLQEEIIHDGIGPLQRTFRFFLNHEDVKHILDKKRKHPYLVQLRFCKLDGSCEQSDYYPVTHQVAVNHQIVLLPGLETMPRGAMRPMDITHFTQVNVQSCNFLTIRCLESCKLFLSIVQKYTSQDLLCRLEEKNPTKEEETTNEIKKKLQGDQADDGIASTTLQCSLLCPLSRTRMKLPCRASTCNHLQCFDAATYLQLNECKPKWSCPVCYQPALYKNLQIDGYFKKILDENTTADKVELQPDGSWTLAEATTKKKPQVSNPVSEERSSEDRKSVDPGDKTVVLDSDDDDATANNSSKQDNQGNKNVSTVTPSRQNNSPEIETIVLSDDDSPDAERPSVTATPYPTYCTTPIERARNAGNNDVALEFEQLANINDIWGRDVISLFRNNCPQLDPFQHSNSSLYIPLSRTSISPPQFNSNSITITRAANQPNSNSSDRLSRNPEGNQSTQEKEKSSTQRVSKSKITKSRKKVHKSSKTTNKGNKQTKRKRRRIIVESSESSDSNLESSKNTSSVSVHKHSAKQKNKKRKRQISDSSEGDKSSIYSSTSNNSDSSVNLISSTNSSSSSNNSSSSSSDSSDNEESEHSDNSFIAAYRHVSSTQTQIYKNYLNGTQQTKNKEQGLAARSHQPLLSQEQSMTDMAICPEKVVEPPESSRVLRSTAQKQKRKKK